MSIRVIWSKSSGTMSDELGDRMKGYEAAYAQKAMPFLPILARIDGKCFHTLAKRLGLHKPFDQRLHAAFIETTKALVDETSATVGYTQSDEITLAWYTENPSVQLFFDGKLQKMTSVLASIATVEFNAYAAAFFPRIRATFDCRVWQVPTLTEATNVFVWREIDATKNSVAMAARTLYSHKALHGMGKSAMMDMMIAKGVNWNNYPDAFKRGTYVRRQKLFVTPSIEDLSKIPEKFRPKPGDLVERTLVEPLPLPPIRQVVNRVDVLFAGADPEVAAS